MNQDDRFPVRQLAFTGSTLMWVAVVILFMAAAPLFLYTALFVPAPRVFDSDSFWALKVCVFVAGVMGFPGGLFHLVACVIRDARFEKRISERDAKLRAERERR